MRIMKTFAAIAAALIISGCAMEDGAGPAPTGPSEFALSVTVSASPDRLPRDGSSQSTVTVTARDASSRPLSGQRFNVVATNGMLSQSDVVTNGNGQATLTITAPEPGSLGNDVLVAVVPVGTNAENAVPRTVRIALSGPSNMVPPSFAVVPFTVTPGSPEVNAPARFDGSGTYDSSGRPATGVFDEERPCMDACLYVWDFGDGNSETGRVVNHTYSVARTYLVKLTVVDAGGTSESAVRTINVTSVAPPAVTLRVEPDPPFVNQQAVFTAVATPATGHSIQRYEWDFGDGTTQTTTTPTVAKMYSTVGIYVVTVAAIDDLGQAGRAARGVSVGYTVAAPVANFTVSPTSATVGATVTFNGSTSTVGVGATIVSYVWDFGDGSAAQSSGTVSNITYVYAAAGTYTVTLTITDSLGRTVTKTATLTVA